MLNLVVKKGENKDHDQSGSSITRLRTGRPMDFVQRSILDFGVGKSSYTIEMCFSFYFSFILVALTSSLHVSLTLTLAVHLSMATTIYFLIFL